MSKILWKKPNGNELETNDMKDTVEYCESLGWERVGDGDSGDGSDKSHKDMSASELKEIFAEMGEDYPGNKDAAVARLEELAEEE